MRHKKAHRKLNKATDQRLALLRSLSRALFINSKITTTLTRAKETKKFSDKLITIAKKGSLQARRQLLAVHPDKELVKKIWAIANGTTVRSGSYLRTTLTGRRRGDASLMAQLELLEPVNKTTKV